MSWITGILGGKFGIYVAGGMAALLLLTWGIVGVQTLRLHHTQASLQEARTRAETAEARIAAAKDAAAVVDAQAGREAATDTQTKESHDAITHAPGAGAAVDPGVDAAGRRALCLRHTLRCTAACIGLLGPCPK